MNNIINFKRHYAAKYTTWASLVAGVNSGPNHFIGQLVSALGVVGHLRKNEDGFLEPFGWFDLRLAGTDLLTEMFTPLYGSTPVPQTPHATTGGLVIPNATDAQTSVRLNGLLFDGTDRSLECDFVVDNFTNASVAVDHGFGAGFKADGVSDTGATLRAGAAIKSASNTFVSGYAYNSLTGFLNVKGTAWTSSGIANGTTVRVLYRCNQNGNINSGTGDAGLDSGMSRIATQTAGSAVTVATNTTVHTDRTDLRALFAVLGMDDCTIRLARMRIQAFATAA